MLDEQIVEDEEVDIDAILNAPDEPEEASDSPESEAPDEESDDDAEEEVEEEISVDDLPDDAELWIGGPTIAEIKAWKEEYGDGNVYVTSITYDKHVVWRTMTRPEYSAHIRNMEKLMESGQLSQAAAGLYNEEAITQLCTLYPEYDRKNQTKELAGLPSLLSQEIMEASGFVALEVRQL